MAFDDPKDKDTVIFTTKQLEDPATLSYALLLTGKYTVEIKEPGGKDYYSLIPQSEWRINIPLWQRCWEVDKPGMYVCKHENDLLGNSFLLYVQESPALGLVFNNTEDNEVFAQTVNCEGNRPIWFYGPIQDSP